MRDGRLVKSILFVCMGNICRSPTLEAVLRHEALKRKVDIHVDSCGIGWSHLGERSDLRSFEVAKKRGILIDHRAQQFQDAFFDAYDLIFAVDQDILEQLKERSPPNTHKIKLATEFSKRYKGESIQDPYYMSASGFEDVLNIALECCEGILNHLTKK